MLIPLSGGFGHGPLGLAARQGWRAELKISAGIVTLIHIPRGLGAAKNRVGVGNQSLNQSKISMRPL
jgi:hypothetical protein